MSIWAVFCLVLFGVYAIFISFDEGQTKDHWDTAWSVVVFILVLPLCGRVLGWW